jgi:hypothetical protein
MEGPFLFFGPKFANFVRIGYDPAVRLEDLLLSEGILDQATLAELVMWRADRGGSLDTALLELGLVDETRLVRLLERACDLRNRVDPLGTPEPAALNKLNRTQAERYRAVPFRIVGRHLDVVLRDAHDLGIVDELGFITGLHIHPTVATEARVAAQLTAHYGVPMPPRLDAALAQRAEPEAKRDWEERLARRRGSMPAAPVGELTPPPVFEEGGAIHDAGLAEMIRAPDTVALPEDLTPPPPPPPVFQYDEVAAHIDQATDPNDVSALALDYLTSFLSRAVLLSIRRGRLTGWDARGGRLRKESVERLTFTLEEPSIFASAAITGAYTGPLPRGPIEEELVIKLGGETWPDHVIVTAIRVQGKTVAILYCEADTEDARTAAHEPVGVIAGFLSDACRRMILLRKGEL